ncbi:MAG: TonB-dependent receptor [Gallionella sp.]|nr:TonB-dependent receptor [Gallionella sp.]PJC04556.1 MAG: hypothetical protein CO069_03160 [Gallionellaceae bacterium CG_4_9_14_0_8_um_filter_60_335]
MKKILKIIMSLACGGTLLAAAAAAAAAAAEVPDELGYFQEFPVVLSASRLLQPLSEAPNAMTVIDRDMIAASGSRTITDLLKLVPGMYVSYYKGSQPIVSYHGTTDQYARRMQVLIDGRSVYLPPLSAVGWADLPITVDDIERIEVIRGPAAASHGANSTQGVISITTRDATAVNGKQLAYTHGTQGINDASVRFGGNGEVYDYRMTLAYTADNGYADLHKLPRKVAATLPNQNSLLRNNNDSNQARLLNYRANFHPGSRDSFDLQFGFNRDVQGVGFVDKNPSAVNPLNLNPSSTNGNTPHDLVANSGYAQFDWIRVLENEDELRLRYYHLQRNQHETFNVYLSGNFIPDPLRQTARAGRDEIEVQHTLSPMADNRLVYGAAWRQDRINAQLQAPFPVAVIARDFNLRSDEWRVFSHDEWRPLDALLVNAGAMYERDRMDNANFSPRAALNLHVARHHTLRAGVSLAYRTPAVVEEFTPSPLEAPGDLWVPARFATAPDLKPERMFSRELGYLGEFPEWNGVIDLRLFSDQLRNGIYASKLSQKFINGAAIQVRGFELTFKIKPDRDGELVLNAAHILARSNSAQLFATGESAFRPVEPAKFNDLTTGSIPRNSGSVLYSRRMRDGWSVSGAFYYQDGLQPFDRPQVDFQHAQHRTDVRAAKTFHDSGDLHGEVALVVQNLFDSGLTEYVANNVFERRVFATLAVRW